MTRERPSGWTIAWLLWLGAFVAIEIPAAIWSKGGTLSEHVWWRWFDETWERWLIGASMTLVAIAHFMFEASAWWSVIIGLVGCTIVIVLAEIRHQAKRPALEWKAHLTQRQKALHNEYPMWTPGKVLREARRATQTLHGPQPKERSMSPLLRKFIVSLIYGVGALGAVVSAALTQIGRAHV